MHKWVNNSNILVCKVCNIIVIILQVYSHSGHSNAGRQPALDCGRGGGAGAGRGGGSAVPAAASHQVAAALRPVILIKCCTSIFIRKAFISLHTKIAEINCSMKKIGNI